MMNNGLSASDIALLGNSNSRGSNDMTNDGWGWIWILLIFCVFGLGGSGFGGFGNNGYTATTATQADIARGFDNQAVINKLDGITNGLCDGFYAMNTSVLSGTNNIQNAIQQASTTNLQNTYAVQQAINADSVANMQNTNALQAQLQQCCCDNKSAIAQTQYQMATDTCAITTAIQQQTQEIMQNCNANYRSLHDEMVQAQMDAKDAKIAEQASAIQALNLAQSQANQNTYLINALKPSPIPAFPASNLYGGLYGNSTCNGCNQTVGF